MSSKGAQYTALLLLAISAGASLCTIMEYMNRHYCSACGLTFRGCEHGNY